MTSTHRVTPGESLASLCERYGFDPQFFWNHPDNAQLRQRRPNPNALAPGDNVAIPEKRQTEQSVATGRVHRFRRRGIPAKLSLQFSVNGRVRADLEYRLVLDDGVERRGTTDEDGKLEEFIPSATRAAKLWLGDDPTPLHVGVGQMDPITEWSGVIKRLGNLGYGATFQVPRPGQRPDAKLSSALRKFQVDQQLDVTGNADATTRARLAALHDDMGASQ